MKKTKPEQGILSFDELMELVENIPAIDLGNKIDLKVSDLETLKELSVKEDKRIKKLCDDFLAGISGNSLTSRIDECIGMDDICLSIRAYDSLNVNDIDTFKELMEICDSFELFPLGKGEFEMNIYVVNIYQKELKKIRGNNDGNL